MFNNPYLSSYTYGAVEDFAIAPIYESLKALQVNSFLFKDEISVLEDKLIQIFSNIDADKDGEKKVGKYKLLKDGTLCNKNDRIFIEKIMTDYIADFDNKKHKNIDELAVEEFEKEKERVKTVKITKGLINRYINNAYTIYDKDKNEYEYLYYSMLDANVIGNLNGIKSKSRKFNIKEAVERYNKTDILISSEEFNDAAFVRYANREIIITITSLMDFVCRKSASRSTWETTYYTSYYIGDMKGVEKLSSFMIPRIKEICIKKEEWSESCEVNSPLEELISDVSSQINLVDYNVIPSLNNDDTPKDFVNIYNVDLNTLQEAYKNPRKCFPTKEALCSNHRRLHINEMHHLFSYLMDYDMHRTVNSYWKYSSLNRILLSYIREDFSKMYDNADEKDKKRADEHNYGYRSVKVNDKWYYERDIDSYPEPLMILETEIKLFKALLKQLKMFYNAIDDAFKTDLYRDELIYQGILEDQFRYDDM